MFSSEKRLRSERGSANRRNERWRTAAIKRTPIIIFKQGVHVTFVLFKKALYKIKKKLNMIKLFIK